MVVPKGYKQSNVGVIPEDWDVRRVNDISDIDSDSLGTSTDPSYSFKYISLEDVDAGKLSGVSELLFRDAPSRARRRIQNNDILMSTVRPNLKSHLLLQNAFKDFICSTGFSVIRCKEDVANSAYIYYHLFFTIVNSQIDNLITGSNYPAISSRDVRALQIPIPPKKGEQDAIATVLSETDSLIENLDKLISKKKAIKQGTMQQLLTGKMRLKGFGTASVESRTVLGAFPSDWEVIEVGDYVDLKTGFPFQSNKYCQSGIKLLRGSNVKRNAIDWSDDITEYWQELTSKIEEYALREGDIVIAMDGALVGKSFARVCKNDLPALLLQRVARLRSSLLDSDFLKECICSNYFSKYCDSVKTHSAIPHISPLDIRKYRIRVPTSKSEQSAIASYLSSMDSEIESLIMKRNKYSLIKQGMMQELLTGKIRLV